MPPGCTLHTILDLIVFLANFKIALAVAANRAYRRSRCSNNQMSADTAFPHGLTALGKHLLQIEMQIVAVDKEVAVGAMVYQVNVVESEDDIPDGVQPGTFTFDAKPTVKDKD